MHCFLLPFSFSSSCYFYFLTKTSTQTHFSLQNCILMIHSSLFPKEWHSSHQASVTNVLLTGNLQSNRVQGVTDISSQQSYYITHRQSCRKVIKHWIAKHTKHTTEQSQNISSHMLHKQGNAATYLGEVRIMKNEEMASLSQSGYNKQLNNKSQGSPVAALVLWHKHSSFL